jgi:hypothetical protein
LKEPAVSFRLFIYYCALCGGCAAYLGWALGYALSGVDHHVARAALRGLFLGLMVALGLGLVDALWNSARGQVLGVILRVLLAVFVGCLGGLLGGAIGQILYSSTHLSLFLILGWTITGLLIGAAPGMYDFLDRLMQEEDTRGARRKVLHGLLGGAVGGLLGGILYLLLLSAGELVLRERASWFWSPTVTGFVALGLCIGLLIGLAQVILKEAWVRVEEGFRAGRELILAKPETTIGRGEGCDIGLFGAAAVEKLHARIVRQGNRYLLADAETPDGTYLNGERIDGPTPLRSGDEIRVGNCVLRFGERQKRS